MHIIIIHYKHWLYDSTSPIWLYTPGLNITGKIVVFFVSVFDCHITVKCDLALSGKKYKNHGLFLYKCDMSENFGVKMSQKYYRSMICHTAKTLLQAQNTQDYKRFVFFFFFPPLQSLLCKFKNLQKQVESHWLPKNRQKRQIA